MPIGIYPRKHYMKTYRKLGPERASKVKALRRLGWSQRALAWSFGVSPRTIGRVLKGDQK